MFRAFSLLLPLLFANVAWANIMIEPYAGYTTGDIKVDGAAAHPITATQTLETKGTIDGIAYGGRVGWMFGRFFLGGDYQGIRAKEKLKGVEDSVNWNSTAIFGVIGWQFFSGFRLYGGMTVRDYEAVEDTSPEQTKFKGSARKVGIGYRYAVPLAINLEYTEYTFKDVEIGTHQGLVKNDYDKLNYNAVILSVSFPFDLSFR